MSTQTELYDKEQIYADYYTKVLQYIGNRSNGHMDAEDLAQTVFVKVFGKWDAFAPEKSSISTWIFNITRNTLIDHQRAMAFRQHGELSETLTDGSDDILDRLILEDEQERLADALESLSQEERDLIILHYYSGHTLMYIAQLMRRPYGQIKRLHVKALEKLKRQMDRENGRPQTKKVTFLSL
jgi:RNA polymerase sigma-70 factor (ECF subfamily)